MVKYNLQYGFNVFVCVEERSQGLGVRHLCSNKWRSGTDFSGRHSLFDLWLFWLRQGLRAGC